ncbi:hypothetical protein [Luteolibacter luteus]|uniref:SO2946-like C-terminal domain-containing protein n=1 Tax=Luteolibacter luteus TaxID=2728835 RepID=A0A858RC93_9BACT|nr:hypothetical protein [Luteolibacter luteus]QJE94224.1 hypothetical protein HHL09_09305 [Luteolibacter luteus]
MKAVLLFFASASLAIAQAPGSYYLSKWNGTKFVDEYAPTAVNAILAWNGSGQPIALAQSTFALASHTQAWSTISNTPTTLAGYGITDAAGISHSHTFASLTSKPTTLGGYGITDAYPLSGNPSGFITSAALAPYLQSATAATTYAPINNPTFTGTVGGISKSMVGLGNADNTSDATKNAASATLTNKTLTSPLINGATMAAVGGSGVLSWTATGSDQISLSSAAGVNLSSSSGITATVTGGGAFTVTAPLTLNGVTYNWGAGALSAFRGTLASGTSDGTKFLRDDWTWATLAGGGSTGGPSSMVVLESDFVTTSTQGAPGLMGTIVSSGTVSTASGAADHPGVLILRDSTTIGGGYAFQTNSAPFLLAGGESFEVVFLCPTAATTVTARLGFQDIFTAADPTDGMWIHLVGDGTGVTASGKTRSNSSETTTGTTYTLTASAWYRAKAELNSGGTTATFTIYDSSGTQVWTSTCTSNIPTGSGRHTGLGLLSTESTTTALTDILYLDWYRMTITRILAR